MSDRDQRNALRAEVERGYKHESILDSRPPANEPKPPREVSVMQVYALFANGGRARYDPTTQAGRETLVRTLTRQVYDGRCRWFKVVGAGVPALELEAWVTSADGTPDGR